MSGEAPYSKLRPDAVMRRAVTGELPKTEDHPGLPSTDPLWSLMRLCWDRNPAARPTMRDVQEKVSLHAPRHPFPHVELRI